MATRRDIEVYQGDDYLLRLEFWLAPTHPLYDPDGPALQPADVSARAFKAQLRPRPNHETLLADFDVDMTHAAEGYVDFTLTEAKTATLRRDCAYDVQQTAAGVTTTPFYGTAVVRREVTV